jgi:hypothetical protein
VWSAGLGSLILGGLESIRNWLKHRDKWLKEYPLFLKLLFYLLKLYRFKRKINLEIGNLETPTGEKYKGFKITIKF